MARTRKNSAVESPEIQPIFEITRRKSLFQDSKRIPGLAGEIKFFLYKAGEVGIKLF